MNRKLLRSAFLSAGLLLAGAQQVQSAESCVATPAQLEANKQLALEFFRPGVSVEERLKIMGPNYVQHNAAFLKYAKQKNLSSKQAFIDLQSKLRPRRPGDPTPPAPQSAGPQPPAGKIGVLLMAECDLVTIVNLSYRQDDTAPPGTWYEAFTFETFRVRDGKLDEHWDSNLLTRELQQRLGVLPAK
jgi:predicted SnoaL-like aldol condensation-catalyzing enzyme